MSSGDQVRVLDADVLEQTAAERAAAIRHGDDTSLTTAKEMRAVSHANDAAFWAEAERQLDNLEVGGPPQVALATPMTWRLPTGAGAALASGGPLAAAGVQRETLWDGPFDLAWVEEAWNEVGGIPPARGTEVLRTADPTGALSRVVLVGSAEEGIAHAQFDLEKAKKTVYVAVRGEMTPQVQAKLARTLGAAVGRAGRAAGVEVVSAFPSTAKGLEKTKASRLCVPAAVAWGQELPPGGRKSWAEALAVMDAGRTPERDKARAKGREQGLGLGIGGPGKPM
jgi:hypothetical protein